MQKYTNYKSICLTKDKKFSQNVGYKIFEINDLVDYLIQMSIIYLKNKYRPTKKYDFKNEFIQIYHENQIYLNPYFQVFKLIEYSKKLIKKMKIYKVYSNVNTNKMKYNSQNLNSNLNYNYYIRNKYEYALLKIYPYRNSIYFDNFSIDNVEIDTTILDPRSLDEIYKLIPRYKNKKENEIKEYNMDLEHPYFKTFCYNTKKFYIYLLEYQMNISNEVIDLCKQYLYNYIIDHVNNLNIKPKYITYYLNEFNNEWEIKYEECPKKNRITFIMSLKENYTQEYRAEYNFPHNITFNEVLKKPEISIEDICEFVKKKYGCVLNFGHDKFFEIPYMDFIDDYKIFLKD